jgi:thioredoxin 2
VTQDYYFRCQQCRTKNRIPAGKVGSVGKCGQCGGPLPTSELTTPQPIMVTDANFEQMVLKSPLPVLVWAWAPWCPTCGAIAPIVDEFAATSKGRVRVGKLNVDTSPQLAQRFNIMSVPFAFIFNNGALQESLPGDLQRHAIMMKMARYV